MAVERLKWEAVGRTEMKQCARPNAPLLKLVPCWMHLLVILAMAVKLWCGAMLPPVMGSPMWLVFCWHQLATMAEMVARLKRRVRPWRCRRI